MGNHRKLRFAIRAALAAATATAVVPVALADTGPDAPAAAAPSSDAGISEVVVTGTRIKSANLDSVSPVATVTAADIKQTGYTRVEDILNNLPMVFAGQNSNVSNGADGTASVDLRGLGPSRTLVLVNGRRLGPGAGDGRSYSDINQIPAALIDHVDLLTGGASATYGADAVAGAVNFVMNTHFQGVQVDGGYNFYNHTNSNSPASAAVSAAGDQLPPNNVNTGFAKNVSVIMGSNFADDRGNATGYITYDQQAAVLQGKYNYSACSLAATSTGGLRCGGSGTSAKNGAGGYFLGYGNSGTAFGPNTVDGKTGAFRPFTDSDEYNYGPLNFQQRPAERWTAGTFVDYEINSHATAYLEVMYTNYSSQAQIAASGDFFQNSFVPCSDPLLTAAEKTFVCNLSTAQGNPSQVIGGNTVTGANLYIGRRNVEGGGRVATFQTDALRALTGVRGDIATGWTYDVYAQRGRVDNSYQNENYFSNANIINSLDVVTGPNGKPTCASVINGTDTKCVPWNIWVPNGVTAAATNYLSIPLLTDAVTTEYIVSGNVTGDLGVYGVKLPSANESIKVNAGAEWRSESAQYTPDEESLLGNAAGSGGPSTPLAGGFTVKEVFAEFTAPLIDNAFLADSLSVLGGYRYSSYSEGFKTNTFKAGLEWAPIHDVKLRTSFQRAVRAPNIGELYNPQSVQLDGSTDPCSGPVGTNGLVASGATPAQCAAAGVSATQYGHIGANPAAQYNGLVGGNPALTPETAHTWSAGLIFQPSALPTFNASVDYFDIKIDNVIGTIGADTILAGCISGNASFCDAIHRDANGSLWRTDDGYVTDVTTNIGSQATRGIDIKLDYGLPLDQFGKLKFAYEATKLIVYNIQPLTGGPSYDCTGYYGVTCGAPNPAFRGVFNTTWFTPWDALNVNLRWRYISSVSSEYTSSNPALSGNALPQTEHFNAYSYFDLSTSFAVGNNVTVQVGANNILDKNPPIVTTGGGGYGSDTAGTVGNGNTYPGVYDSLGRYLFARVTAKF
jgi:outer membrane receptor protein involved in Fe transport